MNHSFLDYRPLCGDVESRRNGVLIAFEEGVSTFYAMKNAEDRGIFFITPGTRVYKGMIVGEHNRPQDLELNVCKTKQLTNHRSATGDELVLPGTVADACTRAAAGSIPSNGALMRVSPLGVWGAGRPIDEVARAARADAALTHGHPYTQGASAAFAVAIGHAVWTGAGAHETWKVALDVAQGPFGDPAVAATIDRKSTRLNSSHRT